MITVDPPVVQPSAGLMDWMLGETETIDSNNLLSCYEV